MLRDYVSSTTEVSSEHEIKESSTEKFAFKIGAGDKLYLYQQTFFGPGVFFTTDVTSITSRVKTPADDKEIFMEVVSRPIEFISGIKVHYGNKESDAPEDRVREWNRKSDDTNYGMKGKYCWIIPQYTTDTAQATSFENRIQGPADPKFKDLAAGAGGDYRYIVPIRDQRTTTKVTQLVLFRDNNFRASNELRGKLNSPDVW